MRMWVQHLASLSALRIQPAVSCAVEDRRGWDPTLLWLWPNPAAVGRIQALAWIFHTQQVGPFKKH